MAYFQPRIKIEGLKELDRALKELPNAVAKGVIRTALKKAAEPIRAAAEAGAPRLTHQLAQSIAISTTLSKRQRRKQGGKVGDVDVYVGASYPDGAHAHLLEFGTSKMSARPFMRPAWEANKGAALDIIKRELWGAIQRAARRLAKRVAA